MSIDEEYDVIANPGVQAVGMPETKGYIKRWSASATGSKAALPIPLGLPAKRIRNCFKTPRPVQSARPCF